MTYWLSVCLGTEQFERSGFATPNSNKKTTPQALREARTALLAAEQRERRVAEGDQVLPGGALVSLNSRLKEFLGPVTRVKKKKKVL